MVRGSCLCGDLAWVADGPFEIMTHCHCSLCRKAHGAAFATAVGAKASAFRWQRGGDARVARFASSPGGFRCFCLRCGSVAPNTTPGGPYVFLPAGCLDDDPRVRPIAHIFSASKAPWHEITDALPRHDEYPPGWGDAVPDPAPVARTPSELGVARGSCLCGAVAFEARGALDDLRNCHCSRCRKAVSGAYATDFAAPAQGFRWLRGDKRVRDFSLRGAKWFVTSFCDTCGSVMPHTMRSDPSKVLIQAGALDGDPGIRVTQHIFVASKAPWVEITDALPQFAGYAPKTG